MSHPNPRAIRTPAGRRAHQGFTLIELMITVTVGIVLLGLALPSFDVAMNSSRVNGQANEFLATLQLARMEAVRRNARVVVCPSTTGTSCAGAGATWTGWVAFVDDGGFSHSYAAGDVTKANNTTVNSNETILRVGNVPSSVAVTSSTNVSGNTNGAIIFRSDGLARDKNGALLDAKISVCVATTHPPENARNVMIKSGGRMAVERAVNADCSAPANTNS